MHCSIESTESKMDDDCPKWILKFKPTNPRNLKTDDFRTVQYFFLTQHRHYPFSITVNGVLDGDY